MNNGNRVFFSGVFLGAMLLVFPTLARAEQVAIAAVVNDSVISTIDVAERRDFILATSETLPTIEAQAQLTPRVLDALIVEALQWQEAQRLGISVTDKEVAEASAQIEAQRKEATGSLAAFIQENHLSQRTLDAQLRAQVAWQKVVEHKIRRSVSIAEDEIRRAQLAQAAAPAIPEHRLMSFMVSKKAVSSPEAALNLVRPIVQRMIAGGDPANALMELKKTTAGKSVRMRPALWIADTRLPPAMLAALKDVAVGGFAEPMVTPTDYELLALLGQRSVKPAPDTTEVQVKQIILPSTLSDQERAARIAKIRLEPNACADTLGQKNTVEEVKVQRGTYGQMPPPMRALLQSLSVGEVSEPLITPAGTMLLRLCERISPPDNLPDAEMVRRALYAEKLELESQKYLRNLRRDAFIERKDGAV